MGGGQCWFFFKSVMSSSSVLINSFSIPCQGHLAAAMECKKYPCGCLSHLPCHVLRLCFVPLCTARCHRTFSCPEYGKFGQNLVEAPDDRHFFFEWHGGLLPTEYTSKHDLIPFDLLCPRKDDAHPIFFLASFLFRLFFFWILFIFGFIRPLLLS